MKVTITLFRDHSRRLSSGEIANCQAGTGTLTAYQIGRRGGYYRSAALSRVEAGGLREALVALYAPELVQISGNGMLLRGIEKQAGRAFLQEWRVELDP